MLNLNELTHFAEYLRSVIDYLELRHVATSIGLTHLFDYKQIERFAFGDKEALDEVSILKLIDFFKTKFNYQSNVERLLIQSREVIKYQSYVEVSSEALHHVPDMAKRLKHQVAHDMANKLLEDDVIDFHAENTPNTYGPTRARMHARLFVLGPEREVDIQNHPLNPFKYTGRYHDDYDPERS